MKNTINSLNAQLKGRQLKITSLTNEKKDNEALIKRHQNDVVTLKGVNENIDAEIKQQSEMINELAKAVSILESCES